jgi:hypothetical protein
MLQIESRREVRNEGYELQRVHNPGNLDGHKTLREFFPVKKTSLRDSTGFRLLKNTPDVMLDR